MRTNPKSKIAPVNPARHKAEAENLPTIDFAQREADVSLFDLGIRQFVALGNWFKFQVGFGF